jgi:methionine synthase I (cobalamin-dependent)
MAGGVVPLIEAGARIIGGCCGSTHDHIREFRRALDGWSTGAGGGVRRR